MRGSSDHVLDEFPVAVGLIDGDVVLGGLQHPESDINGDTTFTFGLQLIQARMVFVKDNMMMMLITSITAVTRMFPMLANTAMTKGHMSTQRLDVTPFKKRNNCCTPVLVNMV